MVDRKGMTLSEMLVALTVFTVATGATMGFLATQQRAFLRGAADLGVAQNLGYALTGLSQEIRTAGTNVPIGQPVVVYAGPTAFAFTADLTTNVANDPFALYYDPDAPTGSVTALRLADQITIPGSSPARTWPLVDYKTVDGSSSSAETIIYWFTPDTETPRGDDYRLMRQANNGTPDLMARNLLTPSATAPFFSYQYLSVPSSGRSTLSPVPPEWMPLSFKTTKGRSDSVRVVTVTYRVTNGLEGAAERMQSVQFAIGMPNIGLQRLQQCGEVPLYSGSLEAEWKGAQNGVLLSFPLSADDLGGERDIVRYVVYRKLPTDAEWGDPYLSLPSSGTTMTYLDQAVAHGKSYQYAVAAQDCTPRLSGTLNSGTVAVP